MVTKNYRWEYGLCTHPGTSKRENQDRVLVKVGRKKGKYQPLMALVADGMGGHSAGSMASELAVQMLSDWWDMQGEARFRANLTVKEEIKGVLAAANQRLVDYGLNREIKTGTTLSALFLYNEEFQVFHVGDSRIYKIGFEEQNVTAKNSFTTNEISNETTDLLEPKTPLPGKTPQLIQLTEDQSWVAKQVRQGKMNKEEARVHPRRNILLECLGIEPALNIIIRQGVFQAQDAFLLCCDGYYSLFPEPEISNDIQSCLASGMDMQSISQHLVGTALNRTAHDNISVIVIKQVKTSKITCWRHFLTAFKKYI